MDLAWNIIVSVVSSGVISASILYGFRRTIDHAANRNLERYKDELRAASELELEQQRAILRQATDTYAARAAALYQRRLDVIADGYACLPPLIRTLERYVNPVRVYALGVAPEAGDAEVLEELKLTWAAYDIFFEKHRIFFDEKTVQLIDEFDSLIQETLKGFMRAGKTVEQQEAWIRIHERVSKLGPHLTDQLRREFARLIGALEGAQ